MLLLCVENNELLAALSALVQREHELLSDFLAHLAELDERRLFLDLGYHPFGCHEARPSLFACCTDTLGLSKSSAGRRIAAARVCRKFPEALRSRRAATPATPPVRRTLEPLSADRFGVRFTADTEFRELSEEVRALASHHDAARGRGDGDLLSLMKRGLEAYRRELQKEHFGVGSKPRLVPSQRAESREVVKRAPYGCLSKTGTGR